MHERQTATLPSVVRSDRGSEVLAEKEHDDKSAEGDEPLPYGRSRYKGEIASQAREDELAGGDEPLPYGKFTIAAYYACIILVCQQTDLPS